MPAKSALSITIVFAAVLAVGTRAGEAIDPAALEAMRDSVCYAETFGAEDMLDEIGIDGADAKEPAGTGLADPKTDVPAPVERPGVLAGKSIDGHASAPCNTIAVPVAKAVPFSTGTLSWWVRFNYTIIQGGTLMTLDPGGGPLYVNFFGKSAKPIMNQDKGHYWNVLAGAAFVSYPNLIEPDVWHHCAFTWNGDRTAFFFDGYLRSGAISRRPFSDLLNGKAHKANTFELCGERALFDEIRVYNRSLSPKEIRTYVEAVKAGGAQREQALALPKQLAPRDTFGAYAVYRLSDHNVLAFADLSTIEASGDKKLSVEILDGSGKTIATATVSPPQPGGMASVQLPLQVPLPEGSYQIRATWAGRQTTASFERARFEWEDNGFGKTDKAMDPWPPVEVAGQTVTCWGRTYTFGLLGLPAAIRSTQPEPSRGAVEKDLLAEPVRLVIEGKDGLLALKGTALDIRRWDETAADITASAEAPGISVRLDGSLEFDGLYKFTVKLIPSTPTTLKSIRIEAALPDDLAILFNASAEDMRRNKAFLNIEGRPDGELWNSIVSTTIRPEQVLEKGARQIVGNLWPHLWLGDDDRGLAVMCDTDRGWLLDPGKPCMDLVRRGGRTVLRIHLLNSPSELEEPLTATLSLQATPVRPRPKGGSWKQVASYGWSCFDEPVIWDGCFKTYSAADAPKMFTDDEARKQNRWWRYFCMQSHRISSSDSHYAMVAPNEDEWEGGLHTPSHRDFLMWVYKQWRDKVGLKGFYMDNTFAPVARNFPSGLAWNDAAGRIHPAFNTFGSRELLKRARALFLEAGPAPVMYAHMTDAPAIGYLGLFDLWLDGENGGYNNLTPEQAKDESDHPEKYFHDFVDRWYSPTGMANLRITLGRQWGTMPKYLYSWGADATYAVQGLFDLEHGLTLMGRRALYDFGLDKEDVVFIPYWDARRPLVITAGGPDVLTAVWRRPGRTRLLISNLSQEDRNVSFRLNLDILGLPKDAVVVDALDGSAVPCQEGAIVSLPVNRHNFRLLLAAAPGVFPAHDPGEGRSLQPVQRIEFFCDDFNTLKAVTAPKSKAPPTSGADDALAADPAPGSALEDKAFEEIQEEDSLKEALAAFNAGKLTPQQEAANGWLMNASPKIAAGGKSPFTVFDSKQGWLRIRNDSYKYAFIYRRFYQDLCSVQVKIGESTDNYGPGYGPSLFLYWSDGSWVRIRAGMERNGPEGEAWAQAIVCEGAGQAPFHAAGPKAGPVNWVKIVLAPDEIEFHACTDGKAWQKIHSRPRTGYRGAPAYVLLGHGAPGRNSLFQNDSYNENYSFYSFFDDFIVGRLP